MRILLLVLGLFTALTVLLVTVVLVAVLFVAGSLLLAAPAAASEPRWTPPVEVGPARLFPLGADPSARGQHRGVDLAASREAAVRAACSGRVVFAGRVAGEGTVSQRCGRWRVSYAPLSHITVRAGQPAGPGTRLGRAFGELHFGVRRESERFGYVDPLRFLGGHPNPAATGEAPPRRGRPPPRAA